MTEEKKTQAWFTDGLHDMQAQHITLKETAAAPTAPLWNIPEGTHRGQNFKECTSLFTLLEGEMARCGIIF